MNIPAAAAGFAALLILALLVLLADNLSAGGMVRGGPDLHHLFERLAPFALLLAVGLGAARISRWRLEGAAITRGIDWARRRALAISAVLIGASLLASLAAVWVLRDFPNSGDENSYLFAARTLLAGRLWNPAPQNPEFFATWHILVIGGKWVSRYEPGWPMVLAALHRAALPLWAVNPLVCAALLIVGARIAKRVGGALAAMIWLVLVALTPFFVFTAASYFNHGLAALGGALFVAGALAWLERPQGWSGARLALGTGAGMGVIVLTRPFDGLIFAIPFGVAVLLRRDLRLFATLPWMIVGAAPFLAGLMFYYYAVTGSVWTPPAVLAGPHLHLGLFPVMDTGAAYTPLDTLQDAVTQIVNLGEWTSPLLLAAWGLAMWRRRRGLQFFDFLFPATILLFMLHAGPGGDRYGPRYYFEAFPFFALTIALAAADLLRQGGERAGAAAGMIAAHVAVSIAALAVLPFFLREMVDQRMEPYDLAAQAGISNAVVVLRASTPGTNHWEPRNLTRNGIALDRPVIYSLDPGARLGMLKAMFPARRFYAYDRQADGQGYLSRL